MAHLQLRKATLLDIPILLKLENSVSIETYSAMLVEDDWKEALQNGVVYIIESDHHIIGSLSYEMKSNNHAYISGLVIEPASQHKGFGKEALSQLLLQLKDIQRVDLVTHPDNHAALKLYQSLGFVIESRKENYYGEGQPRLILAIEKI